ncbi:EAL domain-containing protein [Kineococcus sp. T13]|uniref:EAL domain-containing protein n=1 Tax=Kineococcus vitellinus TaxID=2696565 RepID=UPI0014129EBC|nr:EAL domain-containing protein [Kineococcus vitellinus]
MPTPPAPSTAPAPAHGHAHGPVADFAAAAERTLVDLAGRVGLESWWIARAEGAEHVVLAATDPVFGLSAGSALAWRDTHCRRVVEEGAHPVLRGPLPDSLAGLAAAGAPARVSVVSVPLTSPGGEVLATLCGVGSGSAPALEEALPSVRLQGDLLGALLAAELEVTERARAAERARTEHVDEVTGVAGREVWDAALRTEEQRAARHALPVSLVLLAVDDLTAVNRRDGFGAGDALLHRAARTVESRLRAGDLLARLAGDRFGVLLPGTDALGGLYGTLCAVSAQPDEGLRERDAEVLRAVAEAVMDLVEEEDELQRVRRARLARLDDLDAAGGPRVVYQPIVDLLSAEHVGAEALSRFPAGTPAPDRWFAEAAEVGYGEDLELRAVANALRGLPRLPGFLTVNLSPATLTSPALARLLEGVPLERLVVEITEHAAIEDYAALLATLEPLRRNGLRVAVDDTGAGYASLRHVLAILPDFIKLDISLVRGIDADPSRRALAAGLVTFAASTGARIVAEGIETPAELAALRGLGVQLGQGYHLARPAPLPAAA